MERKTKLGEGSEFKMGIAENYQRVRGEIPDDVTIVVAAKTRNAVELATLIDAGATDIGENYVQEATVVYNQLGEKAKKVRWHMIGALQKNKINKVLPIFDVIQTVDSLKLAEAIDKRSDRIVPVYIEINSGKEPQKSGVMPEEAEETIRRISHL
ncbi:MAG: alanine racemase, partial [Candidatus Latescibacteria bacterium]|nr:alanine racemase [Candidatus Latescibacterota bacterium]